MNTSSMEDRLAAALSARAEQVQAEDLSPAAPPATVTPLRRHLRPALYVAAAAAAVVAVVSVVVVNGGGDTEPTPAVSPTVTDSATPTTGPTPTPDVTFDGQPVDDPGLVAPGTEVRFPSGATGRVDGEELTIDSGGEVGTVGLAGPTMIDPTTGRLSSVELQLGQAGVGYLVVLGTGDDTETRVYVPRDSELVRARVTGGVPFGTATSYLGISDGTRFYTFTTGDGSGLYTRVPLDGANERRYTVYRWEVTGPGEGGAGADNPAPKLVPTELGTFCFDDAGNGGPC